MGVFRVPHSASPPSTARSSIVNQESMTLLSDAHAFCHASWKLSPRQIFCQLPCETSVAFPERPAEWRGKVGPCYTQLVNVIPMRRGEHATERNRPRYPVWCSQFTWSMVNEVHEVRIPGCFETISNRHAKCYQIKWVPFGKPRALNHVSGSMLPL